MVLMIQGNNILLFCFTNLDIFLLLFLLSLENLSRKQKTNLLLSSLLPPPQYRICFMSLSKQDIAVSKAVVCKQNHLVDIPKLVTSSFCSSTGSTYYTFACPLQTNESFCFPLLLLHILSHSI